MKKVYGFVWHVVPDEQVASEGSGGAYCRAFETESDNELAAATIMHTIVQREIALCKVSGCEHTPIIVDKLSPKMIMGGMTANMVKVKTPINKRELVLRVMSALGSLTAAQLNEAFNGFPSEVRMFLNDPDCLEEPTQEEAKVFNLGNNFLNQEYPRIKELIST